MIDALDWFPKEFRAGDADGKINESLMGKPELSPLEILIRETAQNSWDARLNEVTPEFRVSLRSLDARQLNLSNLLPINEDDQLFLQTLDTDSLEVIEISDRRTTGLDGPVDMSPTSDESVSKNFEDLIYKVGVPRHDGKGGGRDDDREAENNTSSQWGRVFLHTIIINPATSRTAQKTNIPAFGPDARRILQAGMARGWPDWVLGRPGGRADKMSSLGPAGSEPRATCE